MGSVCEGVCGVMSALLYVVGALAAVAGAAAIAFGIPVKEFSLGDTLILAGTVALTGGLILIGLGATVAQLQRVAEMLGARPLGRNGLEAARGGRVPFPPKPKAEPPRAPSGELPPFVPAPIEEPAERAEPVAVRSGEEQAPPSIRNPELARAEEAPVEQAEPVKPAPPPFKFPDLPRPSARQPEPPLVRDLDFEPPPTPPPAPPAWRTAAPPRDERPRAEPRPSYFDAMWKDDKKAAPPDAPAPEPRPRADTVAEDNMQFVPPEPSDSPPQAEEPPRAVAVLKSGVVDGMGYTLYVDGSIEAELPDGTLRFASINELRAHLEKTG
jgi:hypothetical protein